MTEYYLTTFKPVKENNPLPKYEPYSLQKFLDDLKLQNLPSGSYCAWFEIIN